MRSSASHATRRAVATNEHNRDLSPNNAKTPHTVERSTRQNPSSESATMFHSPTKMAARHAAWRSAGTSRDVHHKTDQAKPDHPAAPPLIQSGCSTSTATDPRRHFPLRQAVRAPRRAWRRSLKPQTFAAERRPPRTVAQATHRPALSANCPGRSDLLTSTEGWDRGRASAATPGLRQVQARVQARAGVEAQATEGDHAWVPHG